MSDEVFEAPFVEGEDDGWGWAHLPRWLSKLEEDHAVEETALERLRRRGPCALSNAEVVALLLARSNPNEKDLELAVGLLRETDGIGGLLRLDLGLFYGADLDVTRAAAILAAVELARRLVRLRVPEREPLEYPERLATYLSMRYQGDQEVMGALYLNIKKKLIAERVFYRGTINRAAVEPRQIFKHGILCGAVSCAVFHIHPSGDPLPSAEDREFTSRLGPAGKALGIPVVDHIIVGSQGRWSSLRFHL